MLHTITRATAAGCLALAGWAMTGCATPPPDPGVWVSPPTGTVFTYLRRTTGSYGSGETQLVWTVGAERAWEGRRIWPLASPQAGTQLYDVTTHALVAQLNSAGQPVFSFDPPIALQLPLAVGKAWSTKHTMTVHAQQAKLPYEVAVKVEAFEDVTVPAGTYKAFRVVSTDSFGQVGTRWLLPSQGGLLVKQVIDRSASHPQGAGRLEGQLLATTAPK